MEIPFTLKNFPMFLSKKKKRYIFPMYSTKKGINFTFFFQDLEECW